MLKIFVIIFLATPLVLTNSNFTAPSIHDGDTNSSTRDPFSSLPNFTVTSIRDWHPNSSISDPFSLSRNPYSPFVRYPYASRPQIQEDNLTTATNFVSIGKCPGSQLSQNEIVIPSHFMVKGHDSITISLGPATPLTCSKVGALSIPLAKDGKPLQDSVNLRFLQDGVLLIDNSYYNPDQYCFSRYNAVFLSVSHCKLTCAPAGSVLCIPKCCPLHQVVKLHEDGNRECVDSKLKWSPRIYSASNKDQESSHPLALSQPLHYKVSHLTGELIPFTNRPINATAWDEEGQEIMEELEPTPFRLLDDGTLATLIPEPEQNRECGEVVHRLPIYKQFCVDGFLTGDETDFSGKEEDQTVYLPSILEDESKTNTFIKAVVIVIGIFFLILTLLMYVVIWPKHNIHGWTVFSFVVSMLVFFVTLAVVQITHITADLDILNTRPCLAVAILGHFTFLCTLSWMSVMNFNFWATFRHMSVSQERHKSVTRYMAYFVFAVGLPSLITGISVILHFSSDPEIHHNGLLPGYGTVKCQLHPCSQRYYLYIPMACLLGFNLVCFSWTIFSLWTYKQKAAQAGSGSSSRQNQSWVLFCKLFLVMGITWIFECLSGFLNWDFIYFDVINLLQAVAIFFIFTAKRDNLLWIYKRHPVSQRFIRPILRMKFCYVAELDGVEQTEMTSAEKNRITLMSMNTTRISSGSNN